MGGEIPVSLVGFGGIFLGFSSASEPSKRFFIPPSRDSIVAYWNLFFINLHLLSLYMYFLFKLMTVCIGGLLKLLFTFKEMLNSSRRDDSL